MSVWVGLRERMEEKTDTEQMLRATQENFLTSKFKTIAEATEQHPASKRKQSSNTKWHIF